MTTQRFAYKPQSARAIRVSGTGVQELHPTWQGTVQVPGTTTKIGTRSIRMTLINAFTSLLEMVLPSRWEENNFDTSDRRPAAPIHILGNSQVVFDARHRRP